ncbi:membrane protein, putative [Clostridium scatologenes]|uniref:Membrane protein, putative n=1 Tax=Clostridium scatologenes TaxID=1548 RepID=A0A0E3M7B4_CLOSL|nr:membrane protein, putative [Clostridium scatologenes]
MPADNVENSLVKTEKYKKANATEKNIILADAAKQWIKSHPVEFIQLGFKRLFNTYLVGDDVLYGINGSHLSYNARFMLCIITNVIRDVVFIPAVIYIIIYSKLILKSIIANKTDILNKFNIYIVVLFFMFTTIYFVTEGQGRYAFPEIFIMIYSFFEYVKLIILKHRKYVYKSVDIDLKRGILSSTKVASIYNTLIK